MADRILAAFLIAVVALSAIAIGAVVATVRDCAATGEFRSGDLVVINGGKALIPVSTRQQRYICPDGSDRWL
jgi:hypothetical protein